jgi:RNA polymerase sigma factor (sigma-70 family)
LYIYARRCGRQHHDAADATQEFLTCLIEKNKIDGADPKRGRFRNFLLKAFNHFLINEWKKTHARKRCNGRPVLSISDEAALTPSEALLCPDLSAQQAFDLTWRLALINQAVARLGNSLTDEVDRAMFQVFELQRRSGGRAVPKYAEIASQIGISEQNVKTRMHRMHKRLGKLIRDEIRQTVTSESEVEEELRELMQSTQDL